MSADGAAVKGKFCRGTAGKAEDKEDKYGAGVYSFE